jgi:hypothetical protein
MERVENYSLRVLEQDGKSDERPTIRFVVSLVIACQEMICIGMMGLC